MTAVQERAELRYTKKDFTSDQDVRWCPGCGDYAVLSQMQKVMPELGIPREKIVFVSGIGCSSRFPYYMNTYGFHTIHGRAPAVATGLKLARPDLSVWVVTGDGDGLSIGTNHLLHALRRNIDIKILLFNNRVYGLTKGQYSPTSALGQVTKTSPAGSIARPFSPPLLALGAQATFVARSVDTEAQHLQEMIRRMAAHRGTAFLEIYQNCPVFHDGAFEVLKDRSSKAEHLLHLRDGEPLHYGAKSDRALVFDPEAHRLVSVQVGEEGGRVALRHREADESPGLAMMLAEEPRPGMPTPIGVLRAVEHPSFEGDVRRQREAAVERAGAGTLQELLDGGDRWTL